jgi:hypothetical protein
MEKALRGMILKAPGLGRTHISVGIRQSLKRCFFEIIYEKVCVTAANC